jgi:hypothetical protein
MTVLTSIIVKKVPQDGQRGIKTGDIDRSEMQKRWNPE